MLNSNELVIHFNTKIMPIADEMCGYMKRTGSTSVPLAISSQYLADKGAAYHNWIARASEIISEQSEIIKQLRKDVDELKGRV